MKYKIVSVVWTMCTLNEVCLKCEKYNGVSPCIEMNDVFSPTTCKNLFPHNAFPVVQKISEKDQQI